MRVFTRGMVGVLILAGSSLGLQAASLFDFDSQQVGQATPFNDTVGGLTATFSSLNNGVDAPGAFYVQNANPFPGFVGGNNLYQSDSFQNGGGNNYSLRVSLSTPELSSGFNYALEAPKGSSVSLTAYLGGTQVGQITALSGNSFGDNSEYSYDSFLFNAPSVFDSFVLSTNASGLALDDLSISPTAVSGVPEPGSTALMVLGFAGLLAFVRKQKQRRMAAVAVK
jgi:hypothetical protein